MSDWFDPAYKAGGPIRSAVNFVKQMKSDYNIFVLTSDRDLNDVKPINGILNDQWIDYAPGVKVFYASNSVLTLRQIKDHILRLDPHVIYLNSMFSKKFAVYPLWLKNSKRISANIILAPRGMLKGSALQFKKRKKKIFLSLLRWMRIPQLVTFHATDDRERVDILNVFGHDVRVETIPNFPGSQDLLSLPSNKQKGFLDIVFIGRIHPVKGLDILLNALRNSKKKIRLSVVGNPEDISYQNLCRKIIAGLPGNVQVSFIKEVPHPGINQLIREHHILCLPTKGENFGHSIFEALAAGRPVLISDQTPWRNLKKYKAGWDLPLADTTAFSEVIEQCAGMTSEEMNEWCKGAWQFCASYIEASDIKQKYLKLFNSCSS